MKKHANTLFVTTQKSYLAKDGTNLVIRHEGKVLFRTPIHTIGAVVCFGNVGCSPFLMGFCGEQGVSIAFLTERGRFLARIQGRQSGNVRLRRAQHNATSDPIVSSVVAQNLVAAKIANQRVALQRMLRDHAQKVNSELLSAAIAKLSRLIEEIGQGLPVERVRGVEGDAARTYFSVFNEMILGDKETFRFNERTRRPPRDPINALLSFLYVILSNDLINACETVGLDPQMGFLHADRPGRASLALDLVEEFRAFLADRLALSLINRRQLTAKDFETKESGAVFMKDAARKKILIAYQKRKTEEITHPFLDEKVTIGNLPIVQAMLLSRWLRGDLDAYPPYLWR